MAAEAAAEAVVVVVVAAASMAVVAVVTPAVAADTGNIGDLRGFPQIVAEFPSKARLLRQAGFVFVCICLNTFSDFGDSRSARSFRRQGRKPVGDTLGGIRMGLRSGRRSHGTEPFRVVEQAG
jgi:hypothetical protein